MAAFGQISGRLGFDPQVAYTKSGIPVVNLSVANNRSLKDGNERKTVADWHKVVVYGRDAETICQYARKGSTLAFNGRLQNEKYVDREGNQRTSTILVASIFEFVSTGRNEEGRLNGASGAEADLGLNDESEMDIPF